MSEDYFDRPKNIGNPRCKAMTRPVWHRPNPRQCANKAQANGYCLAHQPKSAGASLSAAPAKVLGSETPDAKEETERGN